MTKCKACQAFYGFFRNEFKKFNNSVAGMLNSINHMTLILLQNHIKCFGIKALRFFHYVCNIVIDVIM